MMARLYDRVQVRHEAWTRTLKPDLFRDVSGTVLELGPGTGANFAFYTPKVRWIGIEPNPHMHAALRSRAAEHGIEDAEFRDAGVERMDVPDASIDVVVSTLVLCSVPDLDAALSDIHRVLRPGGRFLFVEHVAAPRGTGVRRLQRLLRPFWKFIADGCRPDRETGAAIRRAGFADVDLREVLAPPGAAPAPFARHIAGSATR